ncbi:hypothetical protein C8Q79DRAFT_970195 [Trametes meyenii]|nr:hypothetical protein C8Q79DRAFT_970195 [Trametes meyenii]
MRCFCSAIPPGGTRLADGEADGIQSRLEKRHMVMALHCMTNGRRVAICFFSGVSHVPSFAPSRTTRVFQTSLLVSQYTTLADSCGYLDDIPRKRAICWVWNGVASPYVVCTYCVVCGTAVEILVGMIALGVFRTAISTRFTDTRGRPRSSTKYRKEECRLTGTVKSQRGHKLFVISPYFGMASLLRRISIDLQGYVLNAISLQMRRILPPTSCTGRFLFWGHLQEGRFLQHKVT